MSPRAACCFAAIAVVFAPAALLGQTTDLRYRVAGPLELTYTVVDTGSTAMSGTPMGTITTGMQMAATYSVTMEPAGDSIRVRVVTDSTVTTVHAMGQTQQMGADMVGNASEFIIGEAGINERMLSVAEEMDLQNVTAGIGQAASANLLLLLPARQVRVGETWTDTIPQTGTVEGITFDGASIIRGTYVGDTAVAGSSYSVIEYVSDMDMTMQGTMQGMQVEQTLAGERRERVLWDPARHVVVERRHDTTMTMNMQMAGQTMTMDMTSGGAIRLRDGG